MNKIILLMILLCGCGGTLYIDIIPEDTKVDPGQYDVIFEARVDRGDCHVFPAYKEQTWVIHESEEGYIWARIQGLVLKSYDKSVFRGAQDGISVMAVAGGTPIGFTGTVTLNVNYGILFSCIDFADFVGIKINTE